MIAKIAKIETQTALLIINLGANLPTEARISYSELVVLLPAAPEVDSQSGEDAMKKPLYLLAFVLALALAYASSQTSGSSPGTSQTPTPSQPPTTSQTTPSTTGTAGSVPAAPDTQGVPAPSNPGIGSNLQGQIQNALKSEPTLANDNINVSVSDDEIDLSGTVATAKEKLTAKRIAQSYAGNRKVKEHLTTNGQSNVANPASNGKPPQR